MASRRFARRLKSWPAWVLLVFVVVGFLAVGATRDSGPQTPEDRVATVSKRLACPVCDGESVYESRNVSSENIRNTIEDHVREGQLSDDEIIAEVQRSQNAQLLLVPQATGLEALAWAIPAVAVVCAGAGLTVAFRRWRAEAASMPDPTDADRELVAEALGSAEPFGIDDVASERSPAGPPPGTDGDG